MIKMLKTSINTTFIIVMLSAALQSQGEEQPFSQLPKDNPVSEVEPAHDVEPTKTVLLLGESLSSDYRVDVKDAWVTQIQRLLDEEVPNWQLVNVSMPSHTVRNAARHLDQYMRDHQPSLILIQLGHNDAFRANAVRDIKSDITTLLRSIKDNNIDIMVIGSSLDQALGENYAKRFLLMHQNIALTEKTGLVIDIMDGVASNAAMLTSDGIHANSAGHQKMVDNAWGPIKEYILCLEAQGNCAFTLPEEEAALDSTKTTIQRGSS